MLRESLVAKWLRVPILAATLALWLPCSTQAAEAYITVASTTSTKNSGLFDHLLPLFEAETGIEVRVVAVGTGQAIRLARNGDADVLFVHHKPSEEAFVAEGYGVARHNVMYNDFVIVGPADDPAKISGTTDASVGLRNIANAQAPFVSRGDDSGTHKREHELWRAADIEVTSASGAWYREVGQGMGATLNAAAGMQGYALTDRGTWLSMRDKLDLRLLAEGDPRLFNQYGIVLVNAAKHPHVKAELGQRFIDWILSPEGQAAIDAFNIGGERLFTANARK